MQALGSEQAILPFNFNSKKFTSQLFGCNDTASDPHKRVEDKVDNGCDTTTGKEGDIPAWDITDDPQGRGANWPDKGMTAAGTKDVVEGQGG